MSIMLGHCHFCSNNGRCSLGVLT